MIRPVTSTSVATNGAEEVAGSNPRRFRRTGASSRRASPRARSPGAPRATVRPTRAQCGPYRPRERAPERDPQEADRAEDRPEHEAGGDLAAQDRPPVAELDLAQGQGPDDQGRGLRARVAPAGDDQRDEQRQDDGLRDLLLEVAHRRRREHLAEEEDDQPATPASGPAPGTAWRRRARRAPPGRRTAGSPAWPPPPPRRARRRSSRCPRACRARRRRARRCGHICGRPRRPSSCRRSRMRATNCPSMMSRTCACSGASRTSRIRRSSTSCALVVDDVDDVERLAVLAVRPDVVEDVPDGPVLPDRDVVRGHQAADGVLAVARAAAGRRRAAPGRAAPGAARPVSGGSSASRAVRSSGAMSLRMPAACASGERREQPLLRGEVEVLERRGRERRLSSAFRTSSLLVRRASARTPARSAGSQRLSTSARVAKSLAVDQFADLGRHRFFSMEIGLVSPFLAPGTPTCQGLEGAGRSAR